jgi:membrane protease YdiL (CAAX protease family)
MSAINTMSSFPSSRYDALHAIQNDVNPIRSSKWPELALIVTGIATTIILSATGVLPASVLLTAKVSAIGTGVIILITLIKNLLENKEHKESKYSKSVNSSSPFTICCSGPIIEEFLFRGGVQQCLQIVLREFVPVVALCLFGVQIPLSAVLAMGVASTVFGAMHARNSHANAGWQAIMCGIGSFCVEAPLFYFHGLWASCLAHIMHNTIIMILVEMGKEAKKREASHELSPVRV